MRIFARLLHYIVRYKARLCLAFALSLLGVGMELTRPWPIKVVVDYVLTRQPLPNWLAAVSIHLPGTETPNGILGWSVAVAILIVVGGAALSLYICNRRTAGWVS